MAPCRLTPGGRRCVYGHPSLITSALELGDRLLRV